MLETTTKPKRTPPQVEKIAEVDPVSLKRALMLEFPDLWECVKVDLRAITWTLYAGEEVDGIRRYRLNGHRYVESGDLGIIFSRYVKAWMEGKYLQYQIEH